MKVTTVTLLCISLFLSGCGSSSTDSGSSEKYCFDAKIYDGDLYLFQKGDYWVHRKATEADYEKYCEIDALPY